MLKYFKLTLDILGFARSDYFKFSKKGHLRKNYSIKNLNLEKHTNDLDQKNKTVDISVKFIKNLMNKLRLTE